MGQAEEELSKMEGDEEIGIYDAETETEKIR